MKNLTKSLLLLLSLSLVGCSVKDSDTGAGSYKDVVYSVVMEASTSGSPFVVKGEYTDEQGKTVTVDEETPWVLTLKNVPAGVKPSFKGYLYNFDTKRIVGTASVVATAVGSGRVIFTSQKGFDLYNESGYTGDELKEATAFDLRMK